MAGYTINLAHGPRSVEELALARVRALRRDAAGTGSPLACPPLWIVVPSHSLRVHLLRRLAERGGPELAVGVRCATAYGVACELAGASGGALPDPVAVLAERYARDEPALKALADLTDGLGLVAAAIRDLLDAGYEPAHLDGLREALAQPEAGAAVGGARRRAEALLRVAACVEQACEEDDLPARHRVYRRAAEAVLRGDGPRLHGVMVHGFAEATGAVSDLLEALLRTYGGALVVDRPRDPFAADRLAGDGKFSERLLLRLQGASSELRDAPASDAPPRPRLIAASRPEAEVEEVAHRVLDLLAQGCPPEEIGVVIRDPQSYRLTLRRRFDALGVPFSASGIDGAALPFRRRLTCLLDLLEQGERLPVERWLELLPAQGEATASDLALALAARGAGRLAAAAQIPAGELQGDAPVRLPVRRVRAAAAAEDPEAESSTEELPADSESIRDSGERHPAIARAGLRRAVDKARSTLEALARLRGRQPLRDHLEGLRGLVDETLGWPREDPARREVEMRVFAPAAALPPAWQLGFDELRRLVAGLLADAGREPLGGCGAGVQVLDVVATRGLTFAHLFLLGMQRGSFPRRVREDPLLPDAVRDVLATQGFGPLPDLPRKRIGHDEEAHLFAQLLSAAPEVTLSWSQARADGEPLSPSPWIDRLRGVAALQPDAARPIWGPPVGDDEEVARRLARRPAEEWARLAGQYGSRAEVARLLPHAVEAALPEKPGHARAVARARLAILEELDPDLGTAAGQASWRRLGPFSGLVGLPESAGVDSTAAIWVTRLEAMARCPWQHFLQHSLRLEAWPDPLTDLPALDSALVGRFVHAVLQAVVARAGTATETSVADALAAGDVRVPWPQAEDLDRIAHQVARDLLAGEGIHLPGLAAGLVARGRAMIDRARSPLWEDATPSVVGSEIDGSVDLAGARISFRADLGVREGNGVRFIDFKTGAPVSEAKKETTRRLHLLDAIARGDALQVAAYAALRLDDAVAGGAYHYLTDREVEPAEARVAAVDGDDAEGRSLLLAAAGRLLEARRRGVYPPRLNLPSPGDNRTPAPCAWCAVRQACLQGESTARIRQRRWVDGHRAPVQITDPRDRAFAELWWMRDSEWRARHEEAAG